MFSVQFRGVMSATMFGSFVFTPVCCITLSCFVCYFWLFPSTVVQHESHNEWRSCRLPVTRRVPLVEQELFSLPQPLHGHMDFSGVSAYWNIDNCSSCLVCAQYCQCLWIVLFWSPFRFSLMFMQYLWVYKYILCNVK
jgi:hypothetical protein